MDSWARNAELFIVDTSEMTAVEVAEAVADWSGL
jgi:hypothetical protein